MASKSQSKTTTGHDEIHQWAEARGGRPAVVKSTHGRGDDTGILQIDFPGYSGSGSLEGISWEDFFEKFDRGKLALVYQETTARGQKSNFNKIVSREITTSRAGSRSGARKSSGRAGSETGRERSRPTAKKTPRKAASAGKGSARKRSSAGKTPGRKSTGRKAAKHSSRSR